MPQEPCLSGPTVPAPPHGPGSGPEPLRRSGRGVAVLATVLGLAGLGIAATRPPVYRATASVLAIAPAGSFGYGAAAPLPAAAPALLRRIVRDEGLVDQPEFASAPAVLFGVALPVALGGASDAPSAREDRAVSALAARLSITRYGSTALADIEVVGGDAALAARLSDAVARGVSAAPPAGAEASGLAAADASPQPVDRPDAPAEIGDGGVGLERARLALLDATAHASEMQRRVAFGRWLDPLPDGLRWPPLDSAKARYVEAVQREAGYRTTLGEKHPVLIEAAQQVRDLRRELAAEFKHAASAAAQMVDRARADQAAAERQARIWADLAAATRRDPVETGAIARPERRAVPDEGPAPLGGSARYEVVSPASVETLGQGVRMAQAGFGALALAGLAGLLATRRRTRTVVQEPDVTVRREVDSGPQVLARVPGPPTPFVADLLDGIADDLPFGATLRIVRDRLGQEIAGPASGGPSVLLVTSLDGDPGVAIGLARVAAQAGQRTLILEAGAGTNLFRTLVGPDAEPALLEVGSAARLLYDLAPRAPALFLAPVHPDEARAVRRAATRAKTRWHQGRTGFDLVVMVASGAGDDVQALAATAAAVLLVARPDHAPADLVAAQRALSRAAPCAIVLAEAPEFVPLRAAA